MKTFSDFEKWIFARCGVDGDWRGAKWEKNQIKIISKLEQMGGNVWYWKKKRSSEGEKWWKKYLHHTKCARCCCRCCVCWSWKKREPTKSSSSEEEGKKEQQFGIFIYCNVILESFFISVGWILNENVDGRGNIWKKRSNDGSKGRESSKHAWIVGSISCVNVNVELSHRALWQDDVEIQFWKMNAISTRSREFSI